MAANLLASPLLHPFLVYVFQATLAAWILGFTSPSSSVRLHALAIQLACVTILVSTSLDRTGRIFWASYFAGNGSTCLLQYINIALLNRWSFETKGAITSSQRSSKANRDSSSNKQKIASPRSTLNRLRFGYRTAFSSRHIGTPDEAKNVPPFSTIDPHYVPSRTRFLLQKATVFLACYTILDLATSGPPQPEANAVNFSARKVPLFSRISIVSSEELVIRLATTLGLWVSLYCVIQAGTSLYAFTGVILHIDEPKHWPPAFGSLKEVYSLRQFWGVFWHQFQRQKLTGCANFLVFDLLHLRKGSLVTRYAHLVAVFLISGLQHALIDVAEGYSWQSSGSIQFFLTQAGGIMFEDAVQAIYSKQHHNSRAKQAQSGKAKYVGYIWVTVFLVWSTPAWIYPALRENKGEEKDILLPYSFVKSLKA